MQVPTAKKKKPLQITCVTDGGLGGTGGLILTGRLSLKSWAENSKDLSLRSNWVFAENQGKT